MPLCRPFLVNNLSSLDSVPIFIQRFFPHFVSNVFAAIRFLMIYAKKDVVLNLNGETGFAIFSVS